MLNLLSRNSILPRRLKVLVLSRSYPNTVLGDFGPWVRRMVSKCATWCDLKVIAPVPYCPPLVLSNYYSKFRLIERESKVDNVDVYHPRFLVGLGRTLYCTEAVSYWAGIQALTDRLFLESSFDLIHAHFTFPDGVVGAQLAKRYGVPLVITEHALWQPSLLDASPVVRRQTVWAAEKANAHIAVSEAVRQSIAGFTGLPEKIHVIPNGVDEKMFSPAQNKNVCRKNQILFVGVLNFNKGVDVLLKAMNQLIQKHDELKLVLVGGAYYRNTHVQENHLRELAQDLGLSRHVAFVGKKSGQEVAQYMRESALLVLPSHRESFGSVLVEALASGIPVISTYCGGPEDIVQKSVGRLVPKNNVQALAGAIEDVIENREKFSSSRLRNHAVERFSWDKVAYSTASLYDKVFMSFRNKQYEVNEERMVV